jgi:hypothetical protein
MQTMRERAIREGTERSFGGDFRTSWLRSHGTQNAGSVCPESSV